MPKFLGVQSCGSSGCHGSARSNFDQVLVWERQDFHTRAFSTLTTARSARMAEVLKLGDPSRSSRCTSCHAPMDEIPAGQRTEMVRAVHGVSCENCHGPAEPWLRTHTRTDLSHADKVGAGMRDLRDLYVRANTCVACHQHVEPELLGAGHPELIFELDGQCATQPRHWRESRGDHGPASWLTGQAVALREMSWQLARAGERSVQEVERWAALVWLLQKVTPPGLKGKFESGVPRDPQRADFARFQGEADLLARAAAELIWSEGMVRSLLMQLAETHGNFEDAIVTQMMQARRAERLILALDRLVTALPPEHVTERAQKNLDVLFKGAQSLPDFRPGVFAAALKEFRQSLGP